MFERFSITWTKSAIALVVFSAIILYFIYRPQPIGNEGSSLSAYAAGHSAKSGPTLAGCPVFPADNVWNTPVDKLPKDVKSDVYLGTMGNMHKLHPDFGADLRSGIPFSIIPAGTRPVRVEFEYRDDSDLGDYPIPSNALIEGGSSSDGDRHIILIDQQRCMLYELFNAHPQPDGTWKAGSGIKMDLTSNALRADGKTSADAAGLAILPGLVRYDEVASGEIRHALRFTVPKTQAAHIWPATHQASRIKDTEFPPMGLRLRLRADFDVSGYSKTNQVILNALKRYGMILADNGGPFFISGAPDTRWSDDDLHKLTNVKGEDFEVVNESDLQMMGDSGRVDPRALPR
ncbi:MAG: hypothetical protein JSS87_11570 [Acidobacteria bacterium]|nr:hypothetical protein [Acidobacteriota bacterium]